MNWIKRLFGKIVGNGQTIQESKDPKDYMKTSLSTTWEADDRYCEKCDKSTSHSEFMSDICNSCGSFNTQIRFGRSYRKIKIDGKWKYQIRYKTGREEIRDGWY
jgi:hypothetical protein